MKVISILLGIANPYFIKHESAISADTNKIKPTKIITSDAKPTISIISLVVTLNPLIINKGA
jgi:hypothetical protein